MRFFFYGVVDAQRRINLHGLIPPNSRVLCYVTDEDFSMLRVEVDAGADDIPSSAYRLVDMKGRMILPKYMSGSYYFITKDVENGIGIKLFTEKPS